MAENHSPIEALFDQVVELPPDERALVLDRHENAQVAAVVRQLLASEEHAPIEFLAGQTPATTCSFDVESDADATIPERIGGYRITRRIGQGGMGSLYEAEQTNPSRRAEDDPI